MHCAHHCTHTVHSCPHLCVAGAGLLHFKLIGRPVQRELPQVARSAPGPQAVVAGPLDVGLRRESKGGVGWGGVHSGGVCVCVGGG